MRRFNAAGAAWIVAAGLVCCQGLGGCEAVLGTGSLSERAPGDGGGQDGTTGGDGSSSGADAGLGPEAGAGCNPGAQRCLGNAVELCGVDHSWGTPLSCTTQTCVGGQCQGVCAPNQRECDDAGPNLESCDSTGQWSGAPCLQPTPTCTAGSCTCDGVSCGESCCATNGDAGCCTGNCPVAHNNGLSLANSAFYDCVAAGTYNLQLAMDACAAFLGSSSGCQAGACEGSDGGISGNLVVCAYGSDCVCWQYAGQNAGLVHDPHASSPSNCICPASQEDPTYQ